MKQRGSAILIAIFLIAAVGSVSFGIGRLYLLDSNLAGIYESSTLAYYAAESGIEEGLLRYRYDQNQVLLGQRIFNLNSGSLIAGEDPQDYAFSPGDRYYAPTVSYLQQFYGQDVDDNNALTSSDLLSTSYPSEYLIPRDESVKLDLSKVNQAGTDVDLLMSFVADDGVSACNPATGLMFTEAKLTGSTPISEELQSKIALVDSNHTNGFDVEDYLAQSSVDIVGSRRVLAYNALIAGIRTKNGDSIFDQSSAVELYLKPIGCSLRVGLKLNGANPQPLLPSPYNLVRSTGYYSGVTRTLEAKIDRQAGTVYDLFDFVLYNK